jgi:hypothetical protein
MMTERVREGGRGGERMLVGGVVALCLQPYGHASAPIRSSRASPCRKGPGPGPRAPPSPTLDLQQPSPCARSTACMLFGGYRPPRGACLGSTQHRRRQRSCGSGGGGASERTCQNIKCMQSQGQAGQYHPHSEGSRSCCAASGIAFLANDALVPLTPLQHSSHTVSSSF